MIDPEPRRLIEARTLAQQLKHGDLKKHVLANTKLNRSVQPVASSCANRLDVKFGEIILTLQYKDLRAEGMASDQIIILEIRDILKRTPR